MQAIFIIFTIILSVLVALLTHLSYLICRLCALPWHCHIAYKPFGWATLILVLVTILTILYGNKIGRFRHQVKELEFSHTDVPEAFDGYRIVHISDIHLDSWQGHQKQLRKRMEEINALDPDLVCFTGDLVSMSADETAPNKDVLSTLKAKDGIVSVLGNHDYLPYSRNLDKEQRESEIARIIDFERNGLGWKLLLNENVIISKGSDSLMVAGCENQSVGAHSVVTRGDLAKAIAPADKSIFRILLSHDPSQWRKEVVGQTDIPLTLSGHTHAMQFRLFGWTPSKWLYPECDGLYTEGGQSLYVNIGLGGTAPLRIGARPEMTLITLKHKD